MRVLHRVVRGIKTPRPGKVYGARLENIALNGQSITLEWAIFGRKTRAKRSKTTKGKA